MKINNWILGLLITHLFQFSIAHACGGCALSKQKSLSSNIQNSPGTKSTLSARSGSMASVEAPKAFKDDAVFKSNYDGQGSSDANWSSSIGGNN